MWVAVNVFDVFYRFNQKVFFFVFAEKLWRNFIIVGEREQQW
jgi:hypothetical protein